MREGNGLSTTLRDPQKEQRYRIRLEFKVGTGALVSMRAGIPDGFENRSGKQFGMRENVGNKNRSSQVLVPVVVSAPMEERFCLAGHLRDIFVQHKGGESCLCELPITAVTPASAAISPGARCA